MSNNNGNDSNNEPKSLSREAAYELAGIFARLDHLQNSPPDVAILRPNGEDARTPNTAQLTREAEVQVLIEHLIWGFMEHGSELLGTWFAMQTEHAPLVRALMPIVKRCVAMPDVQAPLLPDSMRPNTNTNTNININPDSNGGDNV